jgi:hypothetical protein
VTRGIWFGVNTAAPGPQVPQPPPTGPVPVLSVGQLFRLANRVVVAQYELIAACVRAMTQPTATAAPTAAETATSTQTATPTQTDTTDATDTADAATADAANTRTPATDRDTGVPEHLIQARAYELYAERGHQPGDPVDDWRRAEADLRAAADE